MAIYPHTSDTGLTGVEGGEHNLYLASPTAFTGAGHQVCYSLVFRSVISFCDLTTSQKETSTLDGAAVQALARFPVFLS